MEYTYEKKDSNEKLETYEWDNIWWEQANNADMPRMLIIGDSISCGYRRMVADELREAVNVDGIGTSKAVDNEYLQKLIEYVLCQQKYGGIIQFNNGLHGWHLSLDEYRFYYTKLIDYIMIFCCDGKLILASTTPVRDPKDLTEFGERNNTVLERNKIANEIAADRGLIMNDLYAAVVNKPELSSKDGVHLTEEGYRILAKQTASLVRTNFKI